MREKLHASLWHGATALMYALGLALTLLQVTGLLSHACVCIALNTAVIVLLSAAALDRRVLRAAAAVSGAAALIALALGGLNAVMEVLRAVALHMSGLKTALPLLAGETVVLVSLLCAAASWFVTHRSAGAYPALVLLLLAVVLLWLGNQVQALWCLLPAVIASVTLLLQSGGGVPTSRVLPLAVVTVILSFSGLAVGGVAVGPLKNAADGLRQRIYDLFFFTAPRDVFTLATEGYYPQGQGQLGGPAEPHEQPVMVVLTPRTVYLRGAIKNVYTGRSWRDDTEGKRYLWSGFRWQGVRQTTFDMDLPQVTGSRHMDVLAPKTVIVRMLGDSASSMFVPQRVRTLEVEGDLVPYFNVGSEIFATRNLKLADVWTVEAPLFRAGDAGLGDLIAQCESVSDPNWVYVNNTYRALPDHLEPEVYDVAYAAVTGADTPYEMALALQNHLQRNYTYTLDVAEQPPELDFVSTFLLLDKQGYCTYFASAMTVMCRMVGLPARYVEGYVATPDATGQAIVTGKEGHAWTEVYFKGFGWVTFDATPISGQFNGAPQQEESGSPASPETSTPPTATPTVTPDSPAATPVPSPSPVPSAAPQDDDQPTPTPVPEPADGKNGQNHFSLWWLLELLAAGTAGRVLWMTPSMRARRAHTEFGQWMAWVQAIHDALRSVGLRRAANETPKAFFSRVDASGLLREPMKPLGDAETLMFYGHAAPLPEEIGQMRSMYGRVFRTLKPWQKLRIAMERAFLPPCLFDMTRSK